MEEERKFRAALNVIQRLPKSGSFQPSNEMKLGFYAHFKQATRGPCTQARPSFWDPVGRAKHDAWARLGNMSTQDAMQGYVDLLTQIIETINFSPDVQEFIEVLGPFYEFVEDKLTPDRKLDPEVLQNPSPGVSSTISMETSECSEPEMDSSIGDMLGQFDIPEGFDFDRVEPDTEFINGIQGIINQGELEAGTFSQNLAREEKLAANMSAGLDQNHNSFLAQEEDRFLEELRGLEGSLQSSMHMMRDIKSTADSPLTSRKAASDPVAASAPKISSEAVTISSELSQQEIDRMLDRFDGFIGSDSGSIQTQRGVQLSGSIQTLVRGESVQKITTSIEEESSDSDSEDIFEDSVESTAALEETTAHCTATCTRSVHSNDEIKIEGSVRKGYEFGKGSEGHVKGSEGHVKGSEGHVIPEIKITSEYIYSEGFLNSLVGSPDSFNKFRSGSSEKVVSVSLKDELDEDEILVINSEPREEESPVRRRETETDRFLEGIVDHLNHELERVNTNLGHMITGLDHVTARVSGLELNMAQMTNRLNTIEYLLQMVVTRESGWFDRKASLTLPILACAAVLIARVFYERRRL